MGQAKQRGSKETRRQAAVLRAAAAAPISIPCSYCNFEITEVARVAVRGYVPGLDGVFAATCPHCGRAAYAVVGTHAAVAFVSPRVARNVNGCVLAVNAERLKEIA